MATNTFLNALKTQRLDDHAKLLTRLGFILEDRSNDAEKLRDLFDWVKDTWIECKTDKSRFTERLLVEYKANVPLALVEPLPFRRPFLYVDHAKTIETLPERCAALATDERNLAERHYLSYLWEHDGSHAAFDLRPLRARIELLKPTLEFLVCGNLFEKWRTVAALVPLSEVEDLRL